MSSTTHTTDQDRQPLAGIDRSLRHPVMLFLTAGAAWLALAILLGVIASAKVHNPGFLSRHGWLTYGRVFPAHINALVYGWGMQAGFALILWLSARLSLNECKASGTILTAGLVWNLGVALGVTGILSGNGAGMPWMEFPGFVWPVLAASYMAIMIWPFIQFRVRPAGPVAITQWYVLGAMIWFPWIHITANVLLHCLPGHPVMAAGINAWHKSALVFLFFTPVALGVAYDLVANVTGRPASGTALANMGFWSLAIIAPWAGMQKLAGLPVPYFLPYVGAAATVLLFIPICAAASSGWPTPSCGVPVLRGGASESPPHPQRSHIRARWTRKKMLEKRIRHQAKVVATANGLATAATAGQASFQSSWLRPCMTPPTSVTSITVSKPYTENRKCISMSLDEYHPRPVTRGTMA